MADLEKSNTEQVESVSPANYTGKEEQLAQVEDLKKIDTLHDDEGVKVLAAYQGEATWTPEEEKKLVRKIDFRLLTILCCTYGLQYYDKAMLSQAASRPNKPLT